MKYIYKILLTVIAVMTSMTINAQENSNENTPREAPAIILKITKTSWTTIGSESGETIGSATLINAPAFDHISAEIRCKEDPEQYISFADTYTNGGALKCYCWEGGHYELNAGNHYTLTVMGFDVPYYGVPPIATTTYEFVGEGKLTAVYSDIDVKNVNLRSTSTLYHGFICSTNTFDVEFTRPATNVKAWGAMGFDGSENYTTKKKSDDGCIWTVIMPKSVLDNEGSLNVMITAWDSNGNQMKGENADHAYAVNLKFEAPLEPEQPEEDPDEPKELPKCATPTIQFVGGKVICNCETPDALISYEVKQNAMDVKAVYIEGIQLNTKQRYTVTCNATAEGYEQSDTATLEIELNPADVNGDGEVNVFDITTVASEILGEE